jgi:hypothetical protein
MPARIFQQLEPPAFQTVLMYTASYDNVGVSGQLLVLNQGNPEVNAGNIALDQGRDTDYVRIAVSNSMAITYSSYISYDTIMPPYHTAQWQQICLESGSTLYVYSQKGQCTFTFTGNTYDV